MDYEEFIAVVGEQIGDAGEPVQATRATLQVLGERIDEGEARQLAASLPPAIAPWIATQTPAQPFGADEFVRRVAERQGIDPDVARRHAAAVLTALARAVPPKEWDDMVAELPRDFAPLLPRGPSVEVADGGRFIEEVAARAAIDAAAAERATDAVFETLAERIAGGEIDDLLLRLPIELHPPLVRGRDRVRGEAQPMTLTRFIQTVAEREEVSLLDAGIHARAVLQALHDAIGDREFLDITAQLPDDYKRTLAR